MDDDSLVQALRRMSSVLGGDKPAAEQKAKQQEAETIFRSGASFPPTDLPAELIDKLLECDAFSTQDLASLCRVSKALLPPAQRALYKSIKVTVEDTHSEYGSYVTEPKSRALLDCLAAHPELAERVTSFELWIETTDDDLLATKHGLSLEGVSIDDYRLPSGWLEGKTIDLAIAAPAILSSLPNLKRLKVRMDTPYDIDVWFLGAVSLSTVVDLNIPRILPFSYSGFPHLKRLSGGISSDPEAGPPLYALPPVEDLELYLSQPTTAFNDAFIEEFTRNPNYSIKRLSTTFWPQSYFSFAHLVNWERVSLTKFHGHGKEWDADAFSAIVRTLCPSMYCLSIEDYARGNATVTSYLDTYLAHFPPSLVVLSICSGPFLPDVIISFLANLPHLLPDLQLIRISGKDRGLGIFSVGSDSLWKAEDWDKVEQICEEQGVRCEV